MSVGGIANQSGGFDWALWTYITSVSGIPKPFTLSGAPYPQPSKHLAESISFNRLLFIKVHIYPKYIRFFIKYCIYFPKIKDEIWIEISRFFFFYNSGNKYYTFSVVLIFICLRRFGIRYSCHQQKTRWIL